MSRAIDWSQPQLCSWFRSVFMMDLLEASGNRFLGKLVGFSWVSPEVLFSMYGGGIVDTSARLPSAVWSLR